MQSPKVQGKTFISWPCGFSVPKESAVSQPHLGLGDLCFSWIKSLPFPLQVFLPLPCSLISGSPAVLLIDTLRGI